MCEGALVHAGVPMRGMLAGCTGALTRSGEVLLDPTADEQREAATVATFAYLVRQPEGQGAAERQLLLSHVQGGAAKPTYDVLARATQEAALCTVAFCRQALQRS